MQAVKPTRPRHATLPSMLLLWALALALPAAAQSLADLAHQEAERRKALRSQPAKVYGDEDLGRSGGASSTPSDVAPLATTPTPAEADATASQTVDEERAERAESEGVWRDRARAVHEEIARAEIEASLAEAEQARARERLKSARLACPACPEQSIILLDGRPTRMTDNPVWHAAERVEEAMRAVERARAELALSRRKLDDLEEDARRSGAQPGWLRD